MDQEQKTEVREQTSVDGNEQVEQKVVKSSDNVSVIVLVQRIIYFIGTAIIVLLGLRFVLLLLGASVSSDFVKFIYDLSDVFVAPFNGIFNKPTYGSTTYDSATLVAILVYAIVTVGIVKLVSLNKTDNQAV